MLTIVIFNLMLIIMRIDSKIQGSFDSNFHSESQLFTNIRLLNIHNC